MPNYYSFSNGISFDFPTKNCIFCKKELVTNAVRCGECDKFMCQDCSKENLFRCNCGASYCKLCQENLKVKFKLESCSACETKTCPSCSRSCHKCNKPLCRKCVLTCSSCGNYFCKECTKTCTCGNYCCKKCLKKCKICERTTCPQCSYEYPALFERTANGRTKKAYVCHSCARPCRICRRICLTSSMSTRYPDVCGNCESIEIERRELAHLERAVNEGYRTENVPNYFKGATKAQAHTSRSRMGNMNINFDGATETLSYDTSPANWPFFEAKFEKRSSHLTYLGMEWELNFTSSKERIVKAVVEKYLHGSYIWKSDGSICSGGAELVLAPRTLNSFHEVQLKNLCEELRLSGATGYRLCECGIHIHASRYGIPPNDIRKVMAWFMVNRRFVRRFSKRSIEKLNLWAKIPFHLGKWFEGVKNDFDGYYNRHVAINRTAHTWEFRVFASTTRYERIKATLHFVAAILDFAHLHSLAVCCGPNGFHAFMQYLITHKEHEYLLNYIIKEGGLYEEQKIPCSKSILLIPSAKEFAPDSIGHSLVC